MERNPDIKNYLLKHMNNSLLGRMNQENFNSSLFFFLKSFPSFFPFFFSTQVFITATFASIGIKN